MQSQLEKSLQQDIDLIRRKIIEMGGLVEGTLITCLQAIHEKSRQVAYAVILKDRYIDELESELDWLCQKFLIRHQPVGGHMRFVYAVIKINNELERIGDYAESVARKFLEVSATEAQLSYERIVEIANLAIPLLRNAMQAFIDGDARLAKATRAKEKDKTIDNLRYEIHRDLIQLHSDGKVPSDVLLPLVTITNRFERVADQASNICEEVLYMCTGQEIKHSGKQILRVLFVAERDACIGHMAVGIGNALGLDSVSFDSAGISAQLLDTGTVQFMADKGIDISDQTSQDLNQILNLKDYEVIISLSAEAETACPVTPSKTVHISWEVQDPSRLGAFDAEIQTAFEETFHFLDTQVRKLVEAIFGDCVEKEESTDV